MSKAQNDSCKDITSFTGSSGITYYDTPKPYNTADNNTMELFFSKAFYTDSTSTIFLNVSNNSDNAAIGNTYIVIKFEDHDVLKLYCPSVERTYNPYLFNWKYIAAAILNSDDLNKFKTKRIESFIVVDVVARQLSDDFKNTTLNYANCIDALKNKL